MNLTAKVSFSPVELEGTQTNEVLGNQNRQIEEAN